jgi:protein SMG6
MAADLSVALSRSLTAAHPYLSARESILPLFEDEHQARRTQPDVTKAELFVHLHGMLFTKISLDDFEECLARFLERLTEEGYLLKRTRDDWASMGTGPTAPFGDAEWFMIGVINISALLQYGAEDGVLRKHTTKETAHAPSRPASTTTTQKTRTPQAIMLNPSSLKRSETATAHDDVDDGDVLGGDSISSPRLGATADVVMQLNTSTEDDPLVFRLAQRLTCAMLDCALQHPYRIVGDSKVVNPYITLILTFLAHMSQHPAAFRHLERAVPWNRLVDFFNMIPSSIDIRLDVQSKLLGGPLPEDWCIRGMDWTGRHLFGRGYWRPKTTNGGSSRRDECAPPLLDGAGGGGGGSAGASLESEMDALKFDLATLDEFMDGEVEGANSASGQLSQARWRRVATLAAWLARNVAGLDVDVTATGDAPRFAVSGGLVAKLRRWKREDEETAEAERASRISAWARDGPEEDEGDEDEMSSSEDDDDDDDEDPTVRDLKVS